MTMIFIPGWRSANDSSKDSPSAAPSLISSNAMSKARCCTRSRDSSALGVVAISNPRSVKNHLRSVRKFSSSSTTKTDRLALRLITSGDDDTPCAGAAQNLLRSSKLPFARYLSGRSKCLIAIRPTGLGRGPLTQRDPDVLRTLSKRGCILSPSRIC